MSDTVVSTSEVPVTDTLSYAFNTGAVIIGVGSGVGSGRSGSGVVSGVGLAPVLLKA
jgi:hypothetical protein